MVFIIEERAEKMVHPTGGTPTLRLARFLKPSIINPSIGEVHNFQKTKTYKVQKCLPDVRFEGWRFPQQKWEQWVNKMKQMHGEVWIKTGIYNAIIVSTCQFVKDKELILGLADSWCPDTNTIMFPWREATITLEDISILGGFSVLGEPVRIPLTGELLETESKLIDARTKCVRSRSQKASHCEWLRLFMDSNSDLEHVAFLSLWLSRYVSPASPQETIGKYVFPIAIHLSKGIRIALAPTILASLYKDLRLVKECLDASSNTDSNDIEDLAAVTIWATFQMMQLWIWERFPSLQPTPNPLNCGDPRAARWHKLYAKSNFDSVRWSIQSPENFRWIPYSTVLNNWQQPPYYTDQGMVASIDIGDEVFAFSCFVVPSELVGLDCIEQYLPHRVGMQFGLDQDIPGLFTRANANWKIAWKTYSKPRENTYLYIPPRLFESDVTLRYFDWWSKSSSSTDGVSLDVFLEPKKSEGIDELESCSDEDKMPLSKWWQNQQKEGESAQAQNPNKDPVVKIASPILNRVSLDAFSETKKSKGIDELESCSDEDKMPVSKWWRRQHKEGESAQAQNPSSTTNKDPVVKIASPILNRVSLDAFPETKKPKGIDELESCSDEDKMPVSKWWQRQQKEGESAQTQNPSSTTNKDPVVKIASPILNRVSLDAFPETKKSKGINELESCRDEDKMPLSKWLQHQRKEGESAQAQSSSSTTNKSPVVKIASPNLNNEVVTWEDGFYADSAGIPGLELEARIGRLEIVVDKLKGIFGARNKKKIHTNKGSV